jgi:hypothetical protein
MKAHGLLERDDKRYAYRLAKRDVKAALLFVLFPTSNSLGPWPTASLSTDAIPTKQTSPSETRFNSGAAGGRC